ncbi:MAG: universal stress protein [Armatimonadetes bacterium]|nr:universal stress protein [Armatimonadota bacterium]
MIVLGRRRLSGLERVLFGSVSRIVVERAPCSVLIVRPREPRHRPSHPIAAAAP